MVQPVRVYNEPLKGGHAVFSLLNRSILLVLAIGTLFAQQPVSSPAAAPSVDYPFFKPEFPIWNSDSNMLLPLVS